MQKSQKLLFATTPLDLSNTRIDPQQLNKLCELMKKTRVSKRNESTVL